MTEPTFSWLYGATQGQECPSCGHRVWIATGFYSPATMAEHVRYHCDGTPKSTALVVTP